MSTIREQIIDAIVAGITGLDGFGAVIDAGRRDSAAGQALGDALNGGTYAAELSVLDDEQDEAGTSHQLEAMRFQVIVVVHMPTELPGDIQPYQAASRVHEQIRKLYTSTSSAGTWGGLAIDTTNLGGGGVGIHEIEGTVCTASVFEVKYRTLRTDGEVSQ